jgi:hypothetical protein
VNVASSPTRSLSVADTFGSVGHQLKDVAVLQELGEQEDAEPGL